MILTVNFNGDFISELHKTLEAGKATPSPPPPRSDDAVIYANSLTDTAFLPPPPDTWIQDHNDNEESHFARGGGQFSCRSYSPRNDMNELHASMTIRRVKTKDCDSISVSENAQTEGTQFHPPTLPCFYIFVCCVNKN